MYFVIDFSFISYEFQSFCSIAKQALQKRNYKLWRHCPYFIYLFTAI